MLVGHGGAEDEATELEESIILANVIVPLELVDELGEDEARLDEADVDVAIRVDDHIVALPGPYDTGTEDHMPPEKVCEDKLGAP